jgi:multiple sugar transport system permease protein
VTSRLQPERHGRLAVAFLAPALLLLILMNLLPLTASLTLSFLDYNPIIDQEPQFVGLRNYLDLFAGPRQEVLLSFLRTGLLVVLAVGLQTVFGFGFALLLRRRFRGQGYLTTALLLPMMLSPAILAAFWRYMFNADFGIVNWLFDARLSWGGTHWRAFAALLIAEVWMWTPFMALISLSALNGIPQVLYESAMVDRAGTWFRLRHITIPMAAPLVLLGMIFRMVDTFKVFDTAMVLNGNFEGQPTTLVSVLLHTKAFAGSRSIGEAAALAYLMLFVSLGLAIIVAKVFERVKERRA